MSVTVFILCLLCACYDVHLVPKLTNTRTRTRTHTHTHTHTHMHMHTLSFPSSSPPMSLVPSSSSPFPPFTPHLPSDRLCSQPWWTQGTGTSWPGCTRGKGMYIACRQSWMRWRRGVCRQRLPPTTSSSQHLPARRHTLQPLVLLGPLHQRQHTHRRMWTASPPLCGHTCSTCERSCASSQTSLHTAPS